MHRVSVFLATLGLVVGCTGSEPVAPVPPSAPPLPTFLVSGTIQDEAGLPLPEVAVHLDLVTLGRRSTTSNGSGYFSFPDVRGSIFLQMEKLGFGTQEWNLVVASDVALTVTLVRLTGADSIVLGEWVRSVVYANAPPCDPVGWDARAPCRRFLFTAPSTGLLSLEITWSGGSRLDATIIAPGGSYLATSTEVDSETIIVEAPVLAGQPYEIRVNSYYDEQEFDLKAVLSP